MHPYARRLIEAILGEAVEIFRGDILGAGTPPESAETPEEVTVESTSRTIDVCPRCGRAMFVHVGTRCPKE